MSWSTISPTSARPWFTLNVVDILTNYRCQPGVICLFDNNIATGPRNSSQHFRLFLPVPTPASCESAGNFTIPTRWRGKPKSELDGRRFRASFIAISMRSTPLKLIINNSNYSLCVAPPSQNAICRQSSATRTIYRRSQQITVNDADEEIDEKKNESQ